MYSFVTEFQKFDWTFWKSKKYSVAGVFGKSASIGTGVKTKLVA